MYQTKPINLSTSGKREKMMLVGTKEASDDFLGTRAFFRGVNRLR
jgi:hypothetical protein